MRTLITSAVAVVFGSICSTFLDHTISAAPGSAASIHQASDPAAPQEANSDVAFETGLWIEVSPCHYTYDSVPNITTQGYCIKEVFKSEARCKWYLSQARQAYAYEHIWQHSKCVTFAQYRNLHTPFQIIESDGTVKASAGYIPVKKLVEQQSLTSRSSAGKKSPHNH